MVFVQPGHLGGGPPGIVGRDQAQGLHGAGRDALPAAVAGVGVEGWNEVRGVDGPHEPEAASGDHGFTATAAAVADEIHSLAHVLTELDEAVFPGGREELEALGCLDAAGDPVAGEGCGGGAEGHADIQRRVAGPSQVRHFVAAVAQADADGRRCAHHLRGALVVQHVQGLVLGKGPFVHEYPSKLRFTSGEEVPDEGLLHVQVVVEQFGQGFLVHVAPHAHEGKLEEPRHGRRQNVGGAPALLEVQKDRAGGELLQQISRFRFGDLPEG